jgi:2',3'-cyclic-nucleotide 2'-phosphodiesterase (5'-nucleotidase family)
MGRALRIIHVNDTSEATADAWARLAGLVGSLRSSGRCDLLLHAGDVNLSAPSGTVAALLLRRLGVDAVALGNHDLDGGVDALCAQTASLGGRIVCANAAGLPAGCARPYRILRRAGLRVGVLGLTLGDFPVYQPERNLGGLTFLDPVATLEALLPAVRARTDLVVLLSHCGYEPDLAIARRVDGPAVVVGGHSHVLLAAPEPVGSCWVVQAGHAASHAGWLEVDWRPDGLDVRGGVLPTADVPADPAVLRLAATARAADDDEVVAHAATDLRSPDDHRETPFANLLVDLVRGRAGTELALLRCAAVRNDAPPGPLTRGALRRLNTNGADRIARLTLTGAELRALLECGAGEPYYLLTLSGGRVVYDFDRPVGRRVAELTVGGKPVDPARPYTVACSEYLARGIAVYAPLRGKAFETLPVTAQDALEAHVVTHPMLRTALDGRLVVRGTYPDGADAAPPPAAEHPPRRS